MADRVPDDAPKVLALVVALGGIGIAGGTLLLVLTVERPTERLLGSGGLYFLIGLTTVLLIFWAVRTVRGVERPSLRSGFAGRVALVSGCIITAFVLAALILLLAWLAALAIGSEIAVALVRALIMTIFLFLAMRLICLAILEVAIAARQPTGEADA